jgi:N-acyl-D-amino-acid deacylase
MPKYLLKNGRIIDGTRAPAYHGDILVMDGQIALHPSDEAQKNAQVIDCTGLCVAPGFIDIHTHSDSCPLAPGAQASAPYQGATTNIGANCGISIFPLNEKYGKEILDFCQGTIEIMPKGNEPITCMQSYAAAMDKAPKRIHYGTLVGHGTLRGNIIGFHEREATDEELDKMCQLLDRELKAGAFGMSLGLIYPPSSYGNLREFTALGKVLKANNKILTVHMRNESTRIFEAVKEMLDVALASQVHLQISHLKLMGKAQWGRAQELLDLIEGARKQGATITCDQYPYEASSTGLSALVPGWAQDGGVESMLKRMQPPSDKLLKDMDDEINRRGGAHCVEIASTYGHNPAWEGRRLNDIASELNLPPAQAACHVLVACQGAVATIYFSIDPEDVKLIMQDMRIAIGSDGYNFGYDLDYKPHPRSFGTFPRFLQTVRENKLMSLENAVYKMTGLPADILGLTDRGHIADGQVADITVFDPATVSDMSTYTAPATQPQGIPHVFVAGKPVVLDGQLTENFPGTMLTRL